MADQQITQNPLSAAIRNSSGTFWSVGLFSCAVNILMLTGPLFMLQVYDRVLASRSVPTLVALFALVVALYAFMGLFDFVRKKALSRLGYRLDVELMALVKKLWIYGSLQQSRTRARPIANLSAVRQFLTSNALPSLFDLPWVPFYLAIVFLLHVWLGAIATVGAAIVVLATIINEYGTKEPIGKASSWELRESQFADSTARNADTIVAMGMRNSVTEYWENLRRNALSNSQIAGNRSEFFTTLTKSVRFTIQSGILALGAYLAILQEITPGAMIAASILAGRALAPIDSAIGQWKGFIRARHAYKELRAQLGLLPMKDAPVQLPPPLGKLSVSNVLKLPKNEAGQYADMKPILQGINFDLEPGDGLGVIGPSASGKSSLARLIAGLWAPDKGMVRIDGASFDQWDPEKIGKYIGYLPQSVDLIEGSIRENIARFSPDAQDEEVMAAAGLAGVHQLILTLPDGYSTHVGSGGLMLSGGQVQRIALARAVFRLPSIVVLDEPNANLDSDGDIALSKAIETLRSNGSCVIVMAHRPSAIAAVNKILMLKDGKQVDFGAKEEVLKRVTRPAPNLKPVSIQGGIG